MNNMKGEQRRTSWLEIRHVSLAERPHMFELVKAACKNNHRILVCYFWFLTEEKSFSLGITQPSQSRIILAKKHDQFRILKN